MEEQLLLEKVRFMKNMILESDHESARIETGVETLAEVLEASILIIDSETNLVGIKFRPGWGCELLKRYIDAQRILPDYFSVFATGTDDTSHSNQILCPEFCLLPEKAQEACIQNKICLAAFPIMEAGKRIGTLILLRDNLDFSQWDVILAEIGATLLGLMMVFTEADRRIDQARHKAVAEAAFESLSYSEVEAVNEIFAKLPDEESIVVASKIADELGITRSVIVNALRKFESAGIIETRSLGMKGTYIKIKNAHAMDIVSSRSGKI